MIDMTNAEEQELQKLQRAICDIQEVLDKQVGILMSPALLFESTGEFRYMTYTALRFADWVLTLIHQSIDRELNAI